MITDCIQTLQTIDKTPFSFLEKINTTFYDICTQTTITSNSYYDLNSVWGSAVVLTAVALVLFAMYLNDRHQKIQK